MLLDEDVAGDDTSRIAEADLDGGRGTTLVMSGDVVGQPGHHDGLGDVAADDDEVCGSVAQRNVEVRRHGEQDGVARRGDKYACHDESITMLQSIRADGRYQTDYRRGDVDGDRHDLGADGSPAELRKDGRYEKGSRIAGVV